MRQAAGRVTSVGSWWCPLLPALLLAALAPALGTAILVVPARDAWIGVARTVAVAAALTVVAVHLLPASAEALGGTALAVTALAALAPAALERLISGRGHGAGLVLGAVAIGVHQLMDGVQLGLVRHGLGAGVGLGVAAHTAPLVAATVAAVAQHRDRKSAWVVGAGLTALTVIGAAGANGVPEPALHAVTPWLQAAVSGLMLHVVGHDLTAELPRTRATRAADLVGAMAAIAFVATSGEADHATGHGHGHGHSHAPFAPALWEITVESAGVFLVGLMIAAALQARLGGIPARWLDTAGSLRDAVRGALFGVRAPVVRCAPGAIAQGLRLHRAAVGLTVAMLLTSAELAPDGLWLSWRLLGPHAALARLGVALLAGLTAAVVAARLAPSQQVAPPRTGRLHLGHDHGAGRRWLDALDELVHHTAPWLVAGLLVGAYLRAFVHPEELATAASSPLLRPPLFGAAAAVRLSGAGATPVGTAMLDGAAPVGTVVAVLVLASSGSVATWATLRAVVGGRAAALSLVAAVAVVVLSGAVLDLTGLPAAPSPWSSPDHGHAPIPTAAAGLLVLAVLRSVHTVGVRGWVAGLWGRDVHRHADDHHWLHLHESG